MERKKVKGTTKPDRDKRITFAAGASLRLAGDAIDFEKISGELGYRPSHIHRKGQMNQLNVPYETDMWALNSPLSKEDELEQHLDWLGRILLPRKQYILSLKEKFKVDIYCFKTCYTEQANLTLCSKTLKLFVELDLELGVSLIFLPGTTEEVKSFPANL